MAGVEDNSFIVANRGSTARGLFIAALRYYHPLHVDDGVTPASEKVLMTCLCSESEEYLTSKEVIVWFTGF